MLSNYLIQTKPQIEAVIFDLDDTLISWATPELGWIEYMTPMMQRAAEFLAAAGVEIDANVLGVTFGRTVRDAWNRSRELNDTTAVSLAGMLHKTLQLLDVDPDSVDIQGLMRSFEWVAMPGVEPFPDTHAVLTELKQQGYKIGLVTNAFQPMWMRDVELEQDDLIQYFDARITSGDTGFMKPDPAIYWRIMGLLDTTPDKAIFIGDTPYRDILGANLTGLTSVLMNPAHLNKLAETPDEEADYTITTLTELLELLPKIGGYPRK